jgi:APA family basic amino acid/polyamine antiporter
MSFLGSVLRTKDVDTVIHQNDASADGGEAGLSRRLTARDLTGFGIGIVIGTGIFTLTGI